MIKTSKQLKDLIRNLSKKNSADAQILMRNYMMERLLERISLSAYRDKFILKGGMLVAAMVGLDVRSTMDLDATIKGINIDVREAEEIIKSIITVPLEDGVVFHVKRVSEIMIESEYPCVRISIDTSFDGVKTPFTIDISTGDVITPREVRYSFKLMLEDRSIELWAYNLETVLAEKMESIISRNVANTRMRDFYDIYILHKIYGKTLSASTLHEALTATFTKRGTSELLKDAAVIFDEVENSPVMEKLWMEYQKKFSYSADIDWHMVMNSVRDLFFKM